MNVNLHAIHDIARNTLTEMMNIVSRMKGNDYFESIIFRMDRETMTMFKKRFHILAGIVDRLELDCADYIKVTMYDIIICVNRWDDMIKMHRVYIKKMNEMEKNAAELIKMLPN